MIVKTVFKSVLAIVILSGCVTGKKSDTKNNPPNHEPHNVIASWVGECSADNLGRNVRKEFHISKTGFIAIGNYYLDEKCSNLLYEKEVVGTYIVGANKGSHSEIDVTFSERSTTPKNQDGVDILKLVKPKTNWQVNVPHKKTDNIKSFSIFRVDGSSLFIGAGDSINNGSSADTRHVNLSQDVYAKKSSGGGGVGHK